MSKSESSSRPDAFGDLSGVLSDGGAGVTASAARRTASEQTDKRAEAVARAVCAHDAPDDARGLRPRRRGLTPSSVIPIYGDVMPSLADHFSHPERLELPTGHHLRPIREGDVDIDYPAVMGSRDRLWAKYGQIWGWPPADMTYEADREDLAHHEDEIAGHISFNYAVLNHEETELLGCVYIDPPDDRAPEGADALVSWWVIDREAEGELERALDEVIPRWLEERWGFRKIHYAP